MPFENVKVKKRNKAQCQHEAYYSNALKTKGVEETPGRHSDTPRVPGDWAIMGTHAVRCGVQILCGKDWNWDVSFRWNKLNANLNVYMDAYCNYGDTN